MPIDRDFVEGLFPDREPPNRYENLGLAHASGLRELEAIHGRERAALVFNAINLDHHLSRIVEALDEVVYVIEKDKLP